MPFARDADLDPTLHVAVLPQAAHVRMNLDGAGDLSLHLRMREGVAHVTVSGSAAALVDSHSSDLRTSLAGQGVTLGRVEVVASASDSRGSDVGQQGQPQDRSKSDGREPAEREESGKPAPGAAQKTETVGYTISRSAQSHAARTR